MSLRTSSLAFLLLAACGADAGDPVASAAPADRIECALAGASAFEKACVIEREPGGMTLRHGDGGFRRVLLDADRALAAADGAAALDGTALPDGRFELRIEDDRYRLPQ